MTAKASRRAILAWGAVVLGARRALAESDADAKKARVLAEVSAARSTLHTLVGPFTQVRTVGLLSARVRSTGTLTFVRPDRLRWELSPPDAVTYWVTPEALAYRGRAGSGSVRASNPKAAAALDDLRTLLGGDLAHLSERYDLAVSGPDEGPFTFDATPKAGVATGGTHLTFVLSSDRVTPMSATIVEGPRDRTEITFGVLTKNADVDPALLRPPS
jgi:outer membrane lipoprotein-sorting protein